MKVTSMLNANDLEQALTAARDVGETTPVQGLAAPVDAGLLGRVQDVWDSIEGAIRRAFTVGIDKARSLIDAAVTKADEVLDSAKAKFHEIHAALLNRLQAFLHTMTERALSQVHATIAIGGTPLRIVNVDVAHKLLLGGSLKAAITEACAMTAGGEIEVTARYGA